MRNLKRLLFLIIVWTAAPAFAQTSASPASKLLWDETGSSLAVVSAYRYDYSIDGGPAIPLAGVQCTGSGGSAFTCSANFPAATPGAVHNLILVAVDVSVSPPLASDPSTPFPFRFVVSPAPPSNIRAVARLEL